MAIFFIPIIINLSLIIWASWYLVRILNTSVLERDGSLWGPRPAYLISLLAAAITVMGTFLGHLLPGAAFSLLGLWHTFKTISSFKSHAWHPVILSFSVLRHLELLLLLSFSLLAAASQLLSFSADGFEHATIFYHLVIYSLAAISLDKVNPQSELLKCLVNVLATNVFAQELFLLRFHSTDHAGVEGHYHYLLQLIVFVCLISSLVATLASSCFPAALLRSMALTFQGFWFILMGFCLWVPRFMAGDCYPNDGPHGGAVACKTVEADGWARVLANLQFSWAAGGICMLTVAICLVNGRETKEYRRVGGALDVEQVHLGMEEDLKEVRV